MSFGFAVVVVQCLVMAQARTKGEEEVHELGLGEGKRLLGLGRLAATGGRGLCLLQ